ncbi:ParB N-terminal domain-containing protein [Sphingobium sp. AS12]|uniref:ParB/RepB/Spo0J family partition protein n=1 Tax=Sphingobium sp. AS12 TaxID=2849495 RepID=UPI001C31D5DB|nr:ParB/RepB/Spo0J family partition protein [Sphingobium sp. AS12]MBV2148600.1 ParB N-terminal domain-containing protein [Sphingobium sp. AS12]
MTTATKRVRKKAAPVAPETDIQTQTITSVAPSAINPIAYSRLRRAPENVRQTDIAADVESLADDIAAHGLLQSLIGYVWNKRVPTTSAIFIVGGGRRLQALQLLRERGAIGDDFPVPVLIRPKEEAIELSLSENLARRDMNPADEFTAFQELMKPGTMSPADLAKRFGFTERYVKQRLRFATLHPDVLGALRDGKISIEFATEYARTTDQQLQHDVFRAMQRGPSYNRDSIWTLRASLGSKQLTEDSAIFQFIDRATYEAEGGGYVEDLFAKDDDEGTGRRLDKGHLAREIATRCLSFQGDQRVLPVAQRDYPSVAGFVLAPELILGGGKPTAPHGFAEIVGGWSSTLNRHVDIKECWKRARHLEALIHIVVGIVREKPIADDDDGSALEYVAGYDRERFFVPRDMVKQVLPPKEATHYGGQQLTLEQQAEQDLQRDAKLWAARLAGPSFKGTPFEGKVFYGEYWLRTNERRPGDPYNAPRMTAFDLRVFVTDEEIKANMEAGRARAIEERDAVVLARAAKDAAKQAEADAKAQEFADKLAAIRALPALPAVIMAAGYVEDAPSPWFLWASGDYFDLPEDDEHADDGQGLEGIDEIADTMAVIGDFYVTIEEYRAAIAPTEADDVDHVGWADDSVEEAA